MGGYPLDRNGENVDSNSVVVASMILVRGARVVMTNTTFMYSVQAWSDGQPLNWASVGSKVVAHAQAIVGGIWSVGAAVFARHCKSNVECYVCMIESRALWLCRNIGGSVAYLNPGGSMETK